MKSIDLSDVTALEPFVQPGASEPVLVTSHGATVAAVVPVANEEDLEDLMLSRSVEFEERLNNVFARNPAASNEAGTTHEVESDSPR